MKAKKNKRERSVQMQQVSAGLRDVLGMTQWRKEHPKATWAEIEAAVDERINQLRAQLIQDVVQMGETEDWSQKPEVERLKHEGPQAPAGAGEGEKQAMSGDGAFVHLVGGEWAEAKTLALGEVTRNKRGEVCTQHLSYFSRLSDAESFEEAALVETHRRGLERATEVCAVQDGAEWLQGLADYHRADAVRILDFAHAAEYINDIGQAVQAAGGRLPAHWLDGVLHRLKHQGPARVLRHLSWLAARYPSAGIQEKLTYLQKREAHMQYPTYREAGWPIGSGNVESAHKVVVEARLKGAGMRWDRQNVNRMLVLRNAVCNRQWHEIQTTSRAQRQALRTRQRQADSQQRLTSALWFLVFCGVRVYRLSHPPVPVSTSPTAQVLAEHPTRRLGAGYSWHKPFLRRPPSSPVRSEEICAKK